MANTSSAKKAIRVAKRKRKINIKRLDALKSARKTVMELIKQGKSKDAENALPQAYKQIDKAAKNNTIHKNKAARLKSRLAQKITVAKSK